MKLIVIIALLLSSCSKPEPYRASAPANTPVPAAPERVVGTTLSEETDRVAVLAGLKQLSSSNLGQDDVEVRVWFGFGLFPLECLVISRSDGRWSALHLKADSHYQPKKVSRTALRPPKSGWEACWQQLANAGVLNLPDGTDPPYPDAQGYEVQVRNGASYRRYHYISPEYSELPTAKSMLEIGDIISNEFGLERFKGRKPGASRIEAEQILQLTAAIARFSKGLVGLRCMLIARAAAEDPSCAL